MRTPLALVPLGACLLASLPLSAARPEVRGRDREWVTVVDMREDGRWLAHIGVAGRDMPIAVVMGDLAEGAWAAEAFIAVLSSGISDQGTPPPAQAAKSPLQLAIDSEVQYCCGGLVTPPCSNYCWVTVRIRCTPSGCVIETFSPGCKDENCELWGLWCSCPPAPTSID